MTHSASCLDCVAVTDEVELTRRDFVRAIPASVRRRLTRRPFESGVDVAALRSFVRRLNPFKASVVLPGDEPFDPRRQSWAAGALAAIEAFAGAIMALPFALSVAFGVGWLFMGTYQRQSYHFHSVNIWSIGKLVACTLLSAALLWAGLGLMFGWRSRYRAHGVLALVALGLFAARWALAAFWL